MKSLNINWLTFFYVPIASVIAFCFALALQTGVSSEFQTPEIKAATPSVEAVNIPYVCDCAVGTAVEFPSRELYHALPQPPRLEPDKSCQPAFPKKQNQIHLSATALTNLAIFDPKRLAEIERSKKERSKKEKRDKCPLIPIPHSPARKHIPAPSL